jgi:predicted nucleotidyltransferase component of viral defense system
MGPFHKSGLKMLHVNIEAWVNESQDASVREFRQAVHTVLTAISDSAELRDSMIVKGAILISVRFHGLRFTKDIDFSTSEKYIMFNEDNFLRELAHKLALSVETLNYGLDCRIQRHELRPNNKEALYPSLIVNVGYALKGTRKHHKLLKGLSPSILKIDFSFNETICHIDSLEIDHHNFIKAYTLSELVAEKYRAIIQQVPRNRARRQDAYDIFCLLANGQLDNSDIKKQILSTLTAKSISRELHVNRASLADPEIIRRSRLDYDNLRFEITDDLPPFDELYKTVRAYYESLPWKNNVSSKDC